MDHFVADGGCRYAAVLWEEMCRQKAALDKERAVASSDEERQRIEREDAELTAKHQERLREIDRLLF